MAENQRGFTRLLFTPIYNWWLWAPISQYQGDFKVKFYFKNRPFNWKNMQKTCFLCGFFTDDASKLKKK